MHEVELLMPLARLNKWRPQVSTTTFLTAKMTALRAERDSLLLKDRGTKNTAAWRARYRKVTDDLNAAANRLRALRWADKESTS